MKLLNYFQQPKTFMVMFIQCKRGDMSVQQCWPVRRRLNARFLPVDSCPAMRLKDHRLSAVIDRILFSTMTVQPVSCSHIHTLGYTVVKTQKLSAVWIPSVKDPSNLKKKESLINSFYVLLSVFPYSLPILPYLFLRSHQYMSRRRDD